MPIPSPSKDEKQSVFMSRCMGNETVKKEFPDQKQRTAICFSKFRKKSKSSHTQFTEGEVDALNSLMQNSSKEKMDKKHKSEDKDKKKKEKKKKPKWSY